MLVVVGGLSKKNYPPTFSDLYQREFFSILGTLPSSYYVTFSMANPPGSPDYYPVPSPNYQPGLNLARPASPSILEAIDIIVAGQQSTEATLTKLCREYGEVQDKLRLVRSQVSTAQAEYYQWHSKSEAMTSEFYGVEQQLKAPNIDLGLAKAEFAVITEEIGTTKEELANLQHALHSVRQQFATAQDELALVPQHLTTAKASLTATAHAYQALATSSAQINATEFRV
jgi:hypothetical protein